jgi:hypothetical protein
MYTERIWGGGLITEMDLKLWFTAVLAWRELQVFELWLVAGRI